MSRGNKVICHTIVNMPICLTKSSIITQWQHKMAACPSFEFWFSNQIIPKNLQHAHYPPLSSMIWNILLNFDLKLSMMNILPYLQTTESQLGHSMGHYKCSEISEANQNKAVLLGQDIRERIVKTNHIYSKEGKHDYRVWIS